MFGRITKYPPPRPLSWIKYDARPCVVNRATYPYVSFARWDLPQAAWTHNGCLCNEFIALRCRHQVQTPEVKREIDFKFFNKLHKDNPVVLTPMKRWQVIKKYHGQYRHKYIDAKNRLDEFGWDKKYSMLNFFSKDDLEISAAEKAARGIQYRDPCFMLEHATYIKPIEAWFYSLRDEYGTKIVGKADPFTIADDIRSKASCFQDPVFLMLDASKFDSCVDKKWLRYTHKCYLQLFPSAVRDKLRRLSKMTIINRGRSRRGIRYKTHGTRMSGDMDTGLGNSLIMWTLLKSFLDHHGVAGSVYVNGDDSIVVVERRHLSNLRDMSLFTDYGFNMKFEVALTIDQVEFCQSRLLETDYGWTMARNPKRVLARTGWCTRRMGRRKMRDYVHTIGLCERAASWAVPIASAMATALINATPSGKKMFLSSWLSNQYEQMNRWWKTGEPRISLTTRVNYELTWGITVAEQLAIESSFRVKLISSPTAIQLDQLYSLTQ